MEAVFLTVVAKSKTELLTRLVETKFGSAWHIQLENQEPIPLLDWLKENHAATSEVQQGGESSGRESLPLD